jgi:hypothetical protein
LASACPTGLPYYVPYFFPYASLGILLSKPQSLLGIRMWNVEELHIGVHRLLDHLLEGLLLEGLLLLLGLLHPLLDRLLEGLLLLLSLL